MAMPTGSVVTAKEYLEKNLERRGRQLEDAYLDRPVVLALPIFVRRLVAQELATKVEHPYYDELCERDGVLFLPSRHTSPPVAIQTAELGVLRATALVHVGFAGSLDPDLAIGGLFVTEGALNETGTGLLHGHELDAVIPADEALTARLHRWLAEAGKEPVRSRHWTTDVPMKETWEKVTKYRGLGAACVEMEAGGFLSVAIEDGIPASAVYLVSDVLTEDGWVQGWHDPAFKDGILDMAATLAGGQEAIAP
jgi:uridine phosphorylase